MTRAQYTVRLPLALDVTLRRAAQTRQVTAYALLQAAVRTGLAQLDGEEGNARTMAELATEIGALSARLVRVERLGERALYVSTAAYVYARAGAGARTDDAQLTQQIEAAFARQMRLAGGE